MKKDKEINTVFSNTIFLYIMQLSGYIFPFLTFPYLTRVLGPEKYGMVVFGTATMTYFQMLIDFGFILSATKECSVNRNNNEKLRVIVSSVIQAKMFLAFIGLIIIVMLVSYFNSFKNIRLFLLLSFIQIFFTIFIPDYFFRGIEKMNIIMYRTIISKLITTFLIFIFIKDQGDYIYIPIVYSIGNMWVVFSSWYILIKRFNIKFKLTTLTNTFRTLKDSSIFFLSRIATTAYGASNTFVLGLTNNSTIVAQFGTANTLISGLRGLFSPIADSIYPYMVNKKNFRLVKWILYISSPIIIISTIILCIYAEPIILFIAGRNYIEAVPVFRLLLIIFVLTLPIYLLGYPVLGAMNMMKEANISVIIPSIFHILGLIFLLLIGNINLISVSILTCLTETFVLILRIAYVIKGRRINRLNEREY
ncbi:oligosaccharide flippase family protein [Caldibacillus debilis]|jgi:PST family polysaccharide transporter|uniref:Membrane protein involved in the export of O-antigen and teichoic acid n=1 Tax=Caldibacillus debilis GB1 TaxID=1339248 RepID=A0A420VGX4_9BACI|nr:oligosaccharide flippase family protein [Caldibacillus debilis]RKO62837.1 Membrane protein involved in the export of O-antigen and teichoic acid [Caldibacillus debilis GB1]